MTDTTPDTLGGATADLFDKYLLPKAALTTILVASLVGTSVSLSLSLGWEPAAALGKWGYFVALGTLTGGLLWKHAFVRPVDLEGETADYTRRMYDRFDRVSMGAVLVLVLTAPAVLAAYPARVRTTAWVPLVAAAAALLAVLVGWSALRSRPPAVRYRGVTGIVALAAGAVAVAGTARLDVLVRAGDPLAVSVRTVHLLAFGVWVGGAVWNIFVAVPSGQSRPTAPVVEAAGQQLERFRWAVRVILPTLFLTGLYQAVDVFGLRVAPYVETPVGLAVLAKVGLVVLLVGIFFTCPMWRACSPIDGVCDLDDLDLDRPEASREATGDD